MSVNSQPLPLHRTAQSRADELYESLRQSIVDGDLAPNERLVEEAIAASSRMSRTPVREALRRLEMDGLVRATGRGVVVAEFSAQQLADLCVVRESLEGLAARLAADGRSDADVSVLRTLDSSTRAAVASGDVPLLVSLNHRFHETIWQATRNPYLHRQLTLLRSQIERLQNTTLREPDRQRESVVDHERILAAIAAREPETAERRAMEHAHHAMLDRLTDQRTTLESSPRASVRVPSSSHSQGTATRSSRARVQLNAASGPKAAVGLDARPRRNGQP